MKVTYKSISLAVAFFVGTLLLAGCNDSGSSSSGIKYTGSTEQVLIDEGNAVQIATAVFLNTDSMVSTGDLAYSGKILGSYEDTPSMLQTLALALSLVDIIENAQVPSSESGAPYTGAVFHESFTQDGECGGEVEADWSYNTDSGDTSMTMKFHDYCSDEGIILDGTVKIEGGLLTDQLTMTFKNLKSTFKVSQQSVTMSGTIEVEEGLMSTIFDMNMTMRDNTTDKTYKVEDLTVEIIDDGFEIEVILAGRFYDHDNGYCYISTEVSMKFLEGSLRPYEGSLLIEGANGTKALLTIIDEESYRVEADTNGDGTYNYSSGTLTW